MVWPAWESRTHQFSSRPPNCSLFLLPAALLVPGMLQPKGFQCWHCRGCVAHIAIGFSAHWLPSSKAEAAHPRDFIHPATDELFPTLTRSDKPLPTAAMPSLRRELRIPGHPASWGSRPPSASPWLPSLTAVLPRGDGGRTLGTRSRWIPATAPACVWRRDGWCSFYLW